MILAFIGDGEGKTCAALGHAIRAAGHGQKVAVIQFLKGKDNVGEYKYFSESKGMRPHAPTEHNIEIHLVGEPSFVLGNTPKEPHIKKAKEGLTQAKRFLESKKYFLIILDEIFDAVAAGLLPMADLSKLMDSVRARGGESLPAMPHLILTGRILPPELSSKIDLITRMQKIKHYYDKGEKGIEGLDW